MVRSLAPMAPALVLLGYFLIALAGYSIRSRHGENAVDHEVATRPASRLLGRWIRSYLVWFLSPYERALVRLGISPAAVTFASLVAALGAAAALSVGWFSLGGWLYLFAGICDILDGRVARATSRVTRAGAYFDSVIDRYSELFVFAGLAYYYRATFVLLIVLAAAIGSMMVSYARARGQGLGVDGTVGTMQRPERLFYLGVVVAYCPILEALHPSAGRPLFLPTVIALGLLALSSNLTALVRILYTMRRLNDAEGIAARPRRSTERLLSLLRTSG